MSNARPLVRMLVWTVFAFGCGKSDSVGPTPTGTIEIRVADAPATDFQSARVFVSGIALQRTGSPEVVVNSSKISFELTELSNGNTPVLVSADVATGRYDTLRVVVDSAVVTLSGGRTFPGGSATTKLAPTVGAGTGLRLGLNGGITLAEDSTTVVVLSIDGARSVLLQGPPATPTGAIFRPALLAVPLDRAGTISGTVATASSRAAVYAIRGTDTVHTAFADPTTGAFTLRFLPPATYISAARAAGFQVALTLPLLLESAATISGVNLTLNTLP